VAEDADPLALLVDAAQAVEACAAGGVKAAQDPVALAHPGHGIARRYHAADELVADGEARLDLDAAVVDVEVRAADPAGLDGHDRVVAALERGLGAFVHADLVRGLEGDRSHGAS
jgi:hypothetical protein